ncbi:uncharacterized protein JCM6883_006029 [Sporobolomyces salmoneus]|uniref:uncharacterized protein n=1 Tax=Sporobolomyces salmoneus TaxID=183962 RepID=UPI00317FEC1F
MAPQLPVELLRAVVDNFRLPPFSSQRRTEELEKEVRCTLYSLSLTSRVLREIAQPLLYNFIRVQRRRNAETLSLLVDQGSKNGALSSTRTIVFERPGVEEEETYFGDSAYLLNEVPTLLSALEQLIISSNLWSLHKFNRSSLSRVFLNGIDLDTMSISGLIFPSLEFVALYSVTLRFGPLPATSFPKLRRFAFDKDELADEDAATLTALAPQMDSITLMSDIFRDALSDLPTLPLARTLVNLPWHWIEEVRPAESSTVNVRLLVCDIFSEKESHCTGYLDSFASLLKTTREFASLESLYLPPSSSLSPNFRTNEIITSMENVALAAKDRNIEVIFEEQSNQLRGECQVSEEFMRRMTERKITREVEEEKQAGRESGG